ncbi:MAG TPA: MATE family efflux transporter [Roseiflexaceae bacterium]|nr:MATE family efflux transporter [Roseiflexaceae bacterium]
MSAPETAPAEVAPAEARGGEALSRAQLRRRVLGLAAPVIGENLLQTLLGVVDTILVAGLGAAALAGVGAALQVIYIVTAALTALSVGAAVLVAQAVGARQLGEAGTVARQALVWSAIASAPLTALGLAFTGPIIALFGMAPDVAAIGEGYLGITMGSVATIIIMLIAGGVMRGAGDSRTPMLVTLLANVVNVALAYALIYGHFGLPALGALGSAWGTLVSRLIGAALLLWLLWRGVNGVGIAGRAGWRPRVATARGILDIGLPAALEEVVIITAIAALTPVVAALGTVSLAAHRVVINVLSLSFLPGIGFAMATTALVGQSVGARRMDEARAATSIALRWALIWMGGLGAAFLLFAPQLVRIFTDDPQMIAIGALSVQVVALTQPAWAGTFVFGGALRGTGDTRTPLVVSGTAMWVIAGLAFLATRIWPALAAVWAAFLVIGPLEVYLLRRAWRRTSGGT